VGSEVSTQSKVIDPTHALEPGFLSLRGPGQQSGPRIGLALSGGFARGIAHIGVLKVLQEENIPIHFVAGSSFGAFIGALHCAGATAREMEQIACRVRRRHFAQLSISRYGLFSSRRMIKFLNKILKVRKFEELETPLAITATEISTGEGVVFRSGPLAEAVRASCAYPGVFPPVELDGRLLVDGGLTYPVPTQPLSEMGPDRIIAVHLRARTGLGGPRNMFDILAKSFAIAEQRSGMLWQSLADLVVEPEVRQFKYDDFERTPELVSAGERAMRSALPNILHWFEEKLTPAMVEPEEQAYAQRAL
jgi:NTE family protein